MPTPRCFRAAARCYAPLMPRCLPLPRDIFACLRRCVYFSLLRHALLLDDGPKQKDCCDLSPAPPTDDAGAISATSAPLVPHFLLMPDCRRASADAMLARRGSPPFARCRCAGFGMRAAPGACCCYFARQQRCCSALRDASRQSVMPRAI